MTQSREITTPAAMRRMITAVLAPLILATIVGLVVLWPSGDRQSLDAPPRFDATILEIVPCAESSDPECVEAEIQVDSGPDAGRSATVPLPYGSGAPDFATGDEIVLFGLLDRPLEERYQVDDFQRSTPLAALALIFAVAVVALSRWRGVTALAGLALTVVVLVAFVLPALLDGSSPLAVAVVGASTIMIITLYLSHGFTAKTSVALIGTLASLTLTGLLGHAFTHLGQFTGLAQDAAAHLGALADHVDVRGLLLAGLVIGALGVLDDVTVSQAATVAEIVRADPDTSRRSLFAAGLRVGRDHVAATVNTLVLAYAGASLPLLLLFTGAEVGLVDIATTELVAQEVVRALVGGVGIVAAVPITTAVAVLAFHGGTARGRGRRALRSATSRHSD
ncbi:MAG: YibE/F family protein [Actinomycetota bacterium]